MKKCQSSTKHSRSTECKLWRSMTNTTCIDYFWEPMQFMGKWLLCCQGANYLTSRYHPRVMAAFTVVLLLCLKVSLSTKVLFLLKGYCHLSTANILFSLELLRYSLEETVSPFLVLWWHNCKHLSKLPGSLQTYRKKEIHNVHTITALHSGTLCTHCHMPGINGNKTKVFSKPKQKLSQSEKLKNNGSSIGFAIPCSGKERTCIFPKYCKRGLFIQKISGWIKQRP